MSIGMHIFLRVLSNQWNGFRWTEGSPSSSNGDFLLDEDFLHACRKKYSTLSENNQAKTFGRKFMNLMDPLRPFNNLGRSVNSGKKNSLQSAR